MLGECGLTKKGRSSCINKEKYKYKNKCPVPSLGKVIVFQHIRIFSGLPSDWINGSTDI